MAEILDAVDRRALAARLAAHVGETVGLILRTTGVMPLETRGGTMMVPAPIQLEGELRQVDEHFVTIRSTVRASNSAHTVLATDYVPLADVLHVVILGKVEAAPVSRVTLQ